MHDSSTTAATDRRSSSGLRRTFALALLGIVVLQAAWIAALPPFAGLDEQEHVFKAAAVAHGDVAREHRSSPGGWGEFMLVPPDLVAAAEANCESLSYNTVENCRAVDVAGTDLVEVATSAARYNPVYYAVVGTLARPFHGDAALYAMRVVSSLMCAVLLAGAITVARAWGRTRWPMLTVLLAATPVVLFSTIVVAPNGLELCAALLLWTALLGVASRLRHGERVGSLVAIATAAAMPLVVLRSLGPLWCVMIVGVAAVVIGAPDTRRLLRRTDVRRVSALVAVAAATGAAWTLTAGANSIADDGNSYPGSALGVLPHEYVYWVLQSVAAFPFRNEPAPLGVYAVVLAAWWLVIGLAVRQASARERWTLLLVLVLGAAVPVAVTLRAYDDVGPIWQGRYSMPFVMGLILLCGSILDRREHAARGAAPAIAAALAVTTAASTIRVRETQLGYAAVRAADQWSAPSIPLVVGLCIAGSTLLCLAVSRRRGPAQPAVAATQVASLSRAAPESMASAARATPAASEATTSPPGSS